MYTSQIRPSESNTHPQTQTPPQTAVPSQTTAELPKQIKVLIKKGAPTKLALVLSSFGKLLTETEDIYEERDNPNYPDESYEAFVLKMIAKKKLKIEKVLDLK